MYKNQKIELVKTLKEVLKTKTCALVLSHKKLTFSQIDKVRRSSLEATKIIKIKNKVAKIAFEESRLKDVVKDLKGENILILGQNLFDVSKAAKKLEGDTNEIKLLKASSLEDNSCDLDLIYELASLESEKNLQSKLLNVINEVLTKFIRVLNAKQNREDEKV